MFTHVAVAVSVASLLLTAILLLSLRLKSNTRRIHAHVAAALGVAELLFLLGIHRTHNQVPGQRSGCSSRPGGGQGSGAVASGGRGAGGREVAGPSVLTRPLLQLACTAVAILLHYFFLSTFAWLLVQGLHLHRVQVEPRNVDRGAMRFYHALGWGVPAVLLGECPAHRRQAVTPDLCPSQGLPQPQPRAPCSGGTCSDRHPGSPCPGGSATLKHAPSILPPLPRPCRRPGP